MNNNMLYFQAFSKIKCYFIKCLKKSHLTSYPLICIDAFVYRCNYACMAYFRRVNSNY